MTVAALTAFVPRARTLDVPTGRPHTRPVAERCAADLGAEHGRVIAGGPREWRPVPLAAGPITGGLDGGSVRDWEAQTHTWEVIVGHSTRAFPRDDAQETPSRQRWGGVPPCAPHPTRRREESLPAPGVPLTPQRPVCSAGRDTVRDRQLSRSPAAAPRVAGLPRALKRTVLDPYAPGLGPGEQGLGAKLRPQIERLQGSLWPGPLDHARDKSAALESWRDTGDATSPPFHPWRTAGEAGRPSLENHGPVIPNAGERYRPGEARATGGVESTVTPVVSTRCCKKPPRQWSHRGAHLRLPTRVNTLHGE